LFYRNLKPAGEIEWFAENNLPPLELPVQYMPCDANGHICSEKDQASHKMFLPNGMTQEEFKKAQLAPILKWV